MRNFGGLACVTTRTDHPHSQAVETSRFPRGKPRMEKLPPRRPTAGPMDDRCIRLGAKDEVTNGGRVTTSNEGCMAAISVHSCEATSLAGNPCIQTLRWIRPVVRTMRPGNMSLVLDSKGTWMSPPCSVRVSQVFVRGSPACHVLVDRIGAFGDTPPNENRESVRSTSFAERPLLQASARIEAVEGLTKTSKSLFRQ